MTKGRAVGAVVGGSAMVAVGHGITHAGADELGLEPGVRSVLAFMLNAVFSELAPKFSRWLRL